MKSIWRVQEHPKKFEISRPFLEVKSDLDFSETLLSKDIRRHQTLLEWYTKPMV